MSKSHYKFIDLFAGAGGLSEGFLRAGFSPVAHIEMDKEAVNTLKTRMAYHYLLNNHKIDIYNNYLKNIITRDELYKNIPQQILDICMCKTISKKSLPEIYKGIDNILNGDSVDVIIGGPPCQAYSLVGRSIKSAQDKVKIENNEKIYINHIGKSCYGILCRYRTLAWWQDCWPGFLENKVGCQPDGAGRI